MKKTNLKKKEKLSEQPDEIVVEAVKINKENYGLLVDRYQEKIIRYVRRISGVTKEAAEDIAQDVFMKVYVNLDSFDTRSKFSSWLYRIAHNETINNWKRGQKRKALTISMDDNEKLKRIIRDDSDLNEKLYGKMAGKVIRDNVSSLDEKYRQALELNYFKGLSYKEISEATDRPVATVGTLLNRARKILYQKMMDEGFASKILAN